MGSPRCYLWLRITYYVFCYAYGVLLANGQRDFLSGFFNHCIPGKYFELKIILFFFSQIFKGIFEYLWTGSRMCSVGVERNAKKCHTPVVYE